MPTPPRPRRQPAVPRPAGGSANRPPRPPRPRAGDDATGSAKPLARPGRSVGGAGGATSGRSSRPLRPDGRPSDAGHSPGRKQELPATWGNVARRGARVVRPGPGGKESAGKEDRDRGRPPAWQPERWTDETPERRPPGGAGPAGGPTSRRRSRKATKVIAQEVGSRVDPSVAARVERKLGQAADAFERDHLADALRILRPLSKEAPEVPAVRELTGLALYGTGQWAAATKELEAFRRLGGSVEQHPVLADCYRALGRYAAVTELWDELREQSPGAALVTEGRIVAAGAMADQGDVEGAIRLLERGPVKPSRSAGVHHARLWYALADLYERAGDTPKARELFARVVAVEPALADAAERLAALG